MGHYYPWATPWALDELTVPQLEMYLERLSWIEFRRHIHTADMLTMIGNMLGGKGKKDSKPDPEFEPFTPLDFLRPFARMDDYSTASIKPDTAEAFIRLAEAKRLPAWVISTAPWPEIRRAAGV